MQWLNRHLRAGSRIQRTEHIVMEVCLSFFHHYRRETIEALMRPRYAPFRSRIATAVSLDESLELGTFAGTVKTSLGPSRIRPSSWCGNGVKCVQQNQREPSEQNCVHKLGEQSGMGLCNTDVNTKFRKLPETL